MTMMRAWLIGPPVLACLALAGAAVSFAEEGASGQSVRVLKQGDTVFIRTSFSPTEDLVVRVGKGTNRQLNFGSAFLIPAAAA